MDEVLEQHAQQLREIDEHLERAYAKAAPHAAWMTYVDTVEKFRRNELAQMIRLAQAESDSF